MVQVAPLFSARRRLHWAAILPVVVLLAMSGPAAAQGFGWFGSIFGSTQPQPRRPGPPPFPNSGGGGYGEGYGYGGGQQAQTYAPRIRHPKHRPVVTVQKEAPEPPKTDASIFVDVFGDSLGQSLANGLDDALSDRQDVAVFHDVQGSSGLVSTGFYDWPKKIDNLLASQAAPGVTKGTKAPVDPSASSLPDAEAGDTKIDVAIIMIGANDRQPITQDGKTYPLLSDEWTAIYKKRVLAIDEAFQKKGIPLIWVGLPITHDGDDANDMAAFNDIFREAAAKTGAVYVDTWEAFSDDDGEFSAYGPDINGQTVKLRSSDGINFTRAGARKLAHFVEAHVRRALDGKTPPAELPTADSPVASHGGSPAKAPAIAAVKPDVSPIESLNEPPKADQGQLAAIAANPGVRPNNGLDDTVETLLVKGAPQTPPKGRADNFTWPAADGRPTDH